MSELVKITTQPPIFGFNQIQQVITTYLSYLHCHEQTNEPDTVGFEKMKDHIYRI